MDGEKFFFLVIALILALLVGLLGRNRKIGFGWAFLIAVLNVFLGLIVVLCSKKKGDSPQFIDIDSNT